MFYYITFMYNYMFFAFLVILLSVLTLIFNFDNILIIFFSIEMLLFSMIFNFVIFSLFYINYMGFIWVLLMLMVSVSELCMGLSLVISLFYFKGGLKKKYLNTMVF